MSNETKGLTHPVLELCGLTLWWTEGVVWHDIEEWWTEGVVWHEDTKSIVRNATEVWLYDSNCENYERLYKKIRMTSSPKFYVPSDMMPSYFHDYLIEEFIKCDKLAPELEKGKKINVNAIVHWFIWFIQRTKFKEAKDCHERSRGAFTQAEVLKIKNHKDGNAPRYSPQHDISKLEGNGWQVANVVYKMDSDTGESLGTPDYFVKDRTDNLEERSENDYMKELLLKRFGQDKVDLYYSLWLELRYEEYTSKRKWAEARQVTQRVLIQQVDKVKSVFSSNLEAFGY